MDVPRAAASTRGAHGFSATSAATQEPPWREGEGDHPHLLLDIPASMCSARPLTGRDPRAGRSGGGRLMGKFILRRLGFMVLTVFLASIVIFWATTVLPGDVASQTLGRFATEQAKTELRHKLGLDRPVTVQYVTWLGHYVRGDWGHLAEHGYGGAARGVRAAAQQLHAGPRRLRPVRAARDLPRVTRGAAQEHLGRQPHLGRLARLHRPAGVRQRPDPHRHLRYRAALAAVPVVDRPEVDVRGGVPLPDPAGDHRRASRAFAMWSG